MPRRRTVSRMPLREGPHRARALRNTPSHPNRAARPAWTATKVQNKGQPARGVISHSQTRRRSVKSNTPCPWTGLCASHLAPRLRWIEAPRDRDLREFLGHRAISAEPQSVQPARKVGKVGDAGQLRTRSKDRSGSHIRPERHQARELEDPSPEACKVVHRSRSVPRRPRPGARPIPPGASPG